MEHVAAQGDDDGCATFEVSARTGARVWRRLGELAASKGWTLCELGERPFSLEETFLALTEAEAATGGAEGAAARKEVAA